MTTIDNVEKKYRDWQGIGITQERHIQLAIELEILKVWELKWIRMNLDRVCEELRSTSDSADGIKKDR